MLQHRIYGLRIVFILFMVLVGILCNPRNTPAQTESQPRTDHDYCTGNCVVDTYFLHSSMGDTMAKNTYHTWYDTYYELTACNDTSWNNEFSFLVDVLSEFFDAPGAPTMQCWQGVMAQAKACSNSCSEYFIDDDKFGPNLKLTLNSGAQGYLDVTLDNESNLDNLPELEPNSYTRKFPLRTFLQLEGSSALLINDIEMPSLSFPNWITRGGLSDCTTAYGLDANRCSIINLMPAPSSISTSVEFADGAFYDLTNQVNNLNDANGSFSQDGYIRLLSNGDSITIKQGAYAGYYWVKTHNKSTNTHSQHLTAWDASGAPVKITNHECNSITCGIFGDRTESDTYVFALQGSAENFLPGTYTIEVVADLAHDKNINDNLVSYSYTASSVSAQVEEEEDNPNANQNPDLRIEDLPIIDLPGPGIYPNNISDGVPGVLYRLHVPQGIHFMFLRLVSNDGGQFSAFTQLGSLPVPDFPKVAPGDYNCWAQADTSYSGGCPFNNPSPDDFYIFVSPLNGTAFQLEVEWTTSADVATLVAQRTATAIAETGQDQQELSNINSEIEPNDLRTNANSWDLQQPFTGLISKWGDSDRVRFTIPESGIYTFALMDIGPEMKVKLSLLRASSGSYLETVRAAAKGDPVQLTFDGSRGEEYYFVIAPITIAPATNQPYQLTLTGFIPDLYEPNDDMATATNWNLDQGAIAGYFWDKTTGRHDYYQFTAPQTTDGTPISFTLNNPDPQLHIRMTLLKSNGLFVTSTPFSGPGETINFSAVLTANQIYNLKLETRDLNTSLLPYSLSAQYISDDVQTETTDTGRPVRLHGFVYRQNGLLPTPLVDVAIYAQVGTHTAILLDTTNILGLYSAKINVAEGQQVLIRAEKFGVFFEPVEDNWYLDPRTRSHGTNFIAIGAELDQITSTPTTQIIGTLPPPLIQTALVTHQPSPTLLASTTLPPSHPTPPVELPNTNISGYIWRLFPDSNPAGIGAAGLILSINSVDQPAVQSGIDGFYEMIVPDLQPGDQLSLRATASEDSFEPVAYNWLSEAGVDKWQFDFYSYWGTINPPERDDLNHLYGWVLDDSGHGVAGVYLIVQMGTSDALQRIGPTNTDGYYEGNVRLPSQIMVQVWVDQAGFRPSHIQFFHAFAPEEREINFSQ